MFTLTKLNVLWDKVAKLEKGGTSSIPDPSTATDGQLLTVDDGEWIIANPPENVNVIDASTGVIHGLSKTKPNIIVYGGAVYSVFEMGIEATTGAFTSVKASLLHDGYETIIEAGTSTNWNIVFKTTKLHSDYSTAEEDTGKKWIDGKTIYQKTFTGTTENAEVTYLTDYPIDAIVSVSGYCMADSSGSQVAIPCAFSSSACNVTKTFATDHEGCLTINTQYGNLFRNKDYIITVQYTKPTATTNTRSKKSTKKEEETK